jgi:hypothetical protein
MGGKDPGTYFNEGIQIAQRGTLTVHDPLVAAIPPNLHDLFMPDLGFNTYYGSRFMGFYLVDPDEGAVVGQFPHLFPLWVAIGYGAHGLTGARYVVSLLSVLWIMAVHFCGSWLLDRFEVHEYESAYSAYPTEARQKAFEFGIYELLPRLGPRMGFDLDVGAGDDLYVRQFYAKETTAGRD